MDTTFVCNKLDPLHEFCFFDRKICYVLILFEHDFKVRSGCGIIFIDSDVLLIACHLTFNVLNSKAKNISIILVGDVAVVYSQFGNLRDLCLFIQGPSDFLRVKESFTLRIPFHISILDGIYPAQFFDGIFLA